MQKYLYLPRLKHRSVLEQAILKGAATKDFFGTAYGQTGEALEGFRLGDPNIQFDDTLLLIEPKAAMAYATAREKKPSASNGGDAQRPGTGAGRAGPAANGTTEPGAQNPSASPAGTVAPKAKAFFGSVDVNAATAKLKLVSIAEEVIAALAADPNATVKVTLEIAADFPNGASEQTKRTVSENASALGFKSKSWES